MLPFLLSAMLCSASADSITTHQSMQRGAREIWLPTQNEYAINSIVAGGTFYAGLGVASLWKHHHKKQAIFVAIAVIGVHSAAAISNSMQR